MSIDAERFRAFIVGIDAYATGLALTGAVRDALDVARWLVKCGVHPSNLSLCLSSDDRTLLARTQGEFPGATVRPAERQVIWDTLHQSLNTAPDHFFLYWSGHGMMTVANELHLFCSDAQANEFRCFALPRIEAYLRTYGTAHAQRAVIIVDACSDYPKIAADAQRLKPYDVPLGSKVVDGREQFILVSSQPGESALEDEEAGLFTRRLLANLPKRPNLARLFDLTPVYQRLLVEFQNLRDQGRTRQLPTVSQHKYWGDAHLNTTRTPSPQRPKHAVGQAEIEELLQLTKNLEPPPPRKLVCEVLHLIDDDVALPPTDLNELKAFRYCLRVLGGKLDKTALLQFIELCRGGLADPKIDTWERQAAERLRLNLTEVRASAHALKKATPSTATVRVLQFIVQPLPGYPKPRPVYQLYGRISPGIDGNDPLLERTERSARTSEELKDLFADLSTDLMNAFPPEELMELRMEAILPAELLPHGASNWRIRNGAGFLPINEEYDLTLRSYERAYGKYYHRPRILAQKKWQKLAAGLSDENIAWLPAGDTSCGHWANDEWLVLCAESLDLPDSKQRVACLEGLITAGIPLALWFVPTHNIPTKWKEPLVQHFVSKPYGTWPSIARTLCKGAPGKCLSLSILLDDPSVPLPKEPSSNLGALRPPAAGTPS